MIDYNCFFFNGVARAVLHVTNLQLTAPIIDMVHQLFVVFKKGLVRGNSERRS
jgi:hypothetical protein